MHKVWTHPNVVDVRAVASLLEQHGIRTTIKNEEITRTALPLSHAWPEVYVFDESDVVAAQALIRDFLTGEEPPEGERWTCSGCHEEHDAHFDACWNCGRPRGT